MGQDTPWASATDKTGDSDDDDDKNDGDADPDFFPMPFLLVIAGYSIILTLDKVVFAHGKHEMNSFEESSHNDENQILEQTLDGAIIQPSQDERRSERIASRVSLTQRGPRKARAEPGQDEEIIARYAETGEPLQNDPKRKNSCMKAMTPFVLLIGLGVHSIFEGIAMGLENEPDKVLMFGVAIFLHKGTAGMSLAI